MNFDKNVSLKLLARENKLIFNTVKRREDAKNNQCT
jgi:hypothetical protein